jgi:hypothetical protein
MAFLAGEMLFCQWIAFQVAGGVGPETGDGRPGGGGMLSRGGPETWGLSWSSTLWTDTFHFNNFVNNTCPVLIRHV